MKNILLLILLFSATFMFANEQEYEINLKSGKFTPEVTTDFESSIQPRLEEKDQEYIYRLIQFYSIPTTLERQQLDRNGIDLISYIPNKAYISKIKKGLPSSFLQQVNIRSILAIESTFKISPNLKKEEFPKWATKGNNTLLNIKYISAEDKAMLVDFIIGESGDIIGFLDEINTITIQFPTDKINDLANFPLTQWIDLVSPPSTPDNTVGKASTRSNTLNTSVPGGRKYDGRGVVVGLSDDGRIGPHIDFTNRVVFHTDENDGTHGDMTSGIFVGAGNLDPTVGGMAPGSIIHIFRQGLFIFINSYLHIINGVSNKEEFGVAITSTSYGQGVGGVYDASAEFTDQQINQNPSLMHVLSAGNSGTFDHGYGAGPGWANISGGIKAGKNVICAGNVDENDELFITSSRGPAADGRIKPDLCAQGQNHISTNENNTYQVGSGTSASTPAIAGVVAQLYQAYKEKNNGTEPETGLLKAALMNTAEDLGNPGPDFQHGWGRINGLKAARIIEEDRYLSESIEQGSNNNHSIAVPDNVSEVRIMTYWTDVEGNPASGVGLVNDINMQVVTPEGTTHNPWVLDPTPTVASLDANAVEGIDNLNNVEQVVLNNPQAGDYTINIDGFAIPDGPQKYFVLYDFIYESVELTYPLGGEAFIAGSQEIIRWDASSSNENFTLEYSTDDGNTWASMGNIPSDLRSFVWNVPNAIGTAMVRITRGAHTDTTDANFSIAQQVTGFAFSVVCPEEITLVWDALDEAESYDVYLLGETYMEVVGNTTETSLSIPVSNSTTHWAAIVAKNETEGWSSLRTNAISNVGFLNCSLPNDIGVIAINNESKDFIPFCSETSDVIISALISNPGINPQSGFTLSYKINNENPITETYSGTVMPGEELNYNFTTPLSILESGAYSLVVSAELNEDQNSFNNEQDLDFYSFQEAVDLDYVEVFGENGSIPENWTITNNDNLSTWIVREDILGFDGNNTSTILIDNYVYNAPGEEDYFTTEFFDLTSLTSATLTFDLAKAQLSPVFSDGLRVEISTDCGESFIPIYDKADLELSTLDDYFDGRWRTIDMTAEDWRKEQIDLSDYTGEFVQLRFVNINGWGNPTHIDNISLIQEFVNTEESILENIKLFPNPTSEMVKITTNNQLASDTKIVITNHLGQTIFSQNLSENTSKTIDVSDYQTGMYLVSITSNGITETKKLIIE